MHTGTTWTLEIPCWTFFRSMFRANQEIGVPGYGAVVGWVVGAFVGKEISGSWTPALLSSSFQPYTAALTSAPTSPDFSFFIAACMVDLVCPETELRASSQYSSN